MLHHQKVASLPESRWVERQISICDQPAPVAGASTNEFIYSVEVTTRR